MDFTNSQGKMVTTHSPSHIKTLANLGLINFGKTPASLCQKNDQGVQTRKDINGRPAHI